MKVFSIDGITPVIDSTAYVHPSAVLIGDVIVGAGCYIGPCASLRGDYGRIVVRDGANLQDTCVMHGFPNADTVVPTLKVSTTSHEGDRTHPTVCLSPRSSPIVNPLTVVILLPMPVSSLGPTLW